MSTEHVDSVDHHDLHGHEHDDHHGPQSFWLKYVFSTDHKVIGLQFLFTAVVFIVIAAALALGVRYEIAWPQQDVPHKQLLPGKMTDKAPEQNIALWETGGALNFTADLYKVGDTWAPEGDLARVVAQREGLDPANDEDAAKISEMVDGLKQTRYLYEGEYLTEAELRDAVAAQDDLAGQPELVEERVSELLRTAEREPTRIPAAALGYLEKVGRVAVTVPAGTYVEGDEYPLGDDFEGWVDPSDVMADYNFSAVPPQMLAAEGTPIYDTANLEDTQPAYRIVSANLDRQVDATPVELIQRKETDRGTPNDNAIFDSTTVTVRIPAQELDLGDEQPVIVPEATAELSADNVSYIKYTLSPDHYGALFTMHATIMIFFALMPILIGAFGNFLIPLMIGARDMAFPKLNMLSYWIAVPAGVIIIASFWVENGAAMGGWTMYPPLSEYADAAGEQGWVKSTTGTTFWAISIFLIGFSSIVGSLNYITTIINMRAPGMSLFRMPLTVWSLLITALLLLLATPVLAAAGIMLALDRIIGTQFFQDTLIIEGGEVVAAGGQPLLWQHLFWFFGHPEVYILILPAMGITSDILATFARKPIFGYKPMVYAICAIAGLGFIVWGHHMFQSGMNPALGTTFMASTIMIAVPSAIKTFNWLGTLWGGNIKFTPSMLYAIGFVSMFVIGGLSGIFMAAAPVDIHIHDTYFIVAHIHYVLFGGTLMGIFAGIYHWYPKMFGTQMNQKWGWVHFFMTLIALNGTFFMMHVLGVGGHPRRYANIMSYPTLRHLQPMNVMMSIFALMLGMAQIPFLYNFFVSLPRKLGRATIAIITFAWAGPMIIGLSWWAAEDQNDLIQATGQTVRGPIATFMTHLVSYVPRQFVGGQAFEGTAQYTAGAAALGFFALAAALIALLIALVRGLTFGGKVAAVCILVPTILWAVVTMGSGGTLYNQQGNLQYALNFDTDKFESKTLATLMEEAESGDALAAALGEQIDKQWNSDGAMPRARVKQAAIEAMKGQAIAGADEATSAALAEQVAAAVSAEVKELRLIDVGGKPAAGEGGAVASAQSGAASGATGAVASTVAAADPGASDAEKTDTAGKVGDGEKLAAEVSDLVLVAESKSQLATQIGSLVESRLKTPQEQLLPRVRQDVVEHAAAAGDLSELEKHDRQHLAAAIMAPLHALTDVEEAKTAKKFHDLCIAVGHGVILLAIVVGLVWLVWYVGGLLNMPAILQRVLWVVFIPLFLAPVLLRPDFYMWLGNTDLFEWRWLFMILVALPGLGYLVVHRPKDEFGYYPGTNPWQANSLEWVATTSPPLAHGNFDEIPTVYRGPYEYSSPAVEEDWLPQNLKLPPGVVEPEAH